MDFALPQVSLEEEKRVVQTMIKFGLSPKYKGYVFLKETLLFLKYYDDLAHGISLSKELYPLIAKKYGTIVYDVERNIRFAIERAMLEIRVSVLKESFGETVLNAMSNGKMSCKNFIKTICEYMKYN